MCYGVTSQKKADVYNFGVVALEIVCGRSNASYRAQSGCVCLLDWTFNLQQKGNLMEILDPKLEYKFDKEEAERMVKVALLCYNASPTLSLTMSKVVSMLVLQTIIQEVILDPSIYGSDFQLQQLNQNSRGNSTTPNFSSDKTCVGLSITSVHDLYSINSECTRNLISTEDLCPLNPKTIYLNPSGSSFVLHNGSRV
ncbi:hypothetical protein Pint_10244 [Pistacia integerrima]|uniref:Uncharacterized protein n=1 Tax=Pistacia integerrima TaxID=434235 RepID=A0ACC0XK21_9ROSI|nr:hypothetical protein Pint_10244 [Pistacia integerrima]